MASTIAGCFYVSLSIYISGAYGREARVRHDAEELVVASGCELPPARWVQLVSEDKGKTASYSVPTQPTTG